jgi:hypothetical protein
MAITTAGSSNFTEMVNPIIPLNLMGGRAQFKDFIGVWEGFMPAPVCSDLISFFQQWKQQATIKGEDSDLQFTDFAEGANEGMSGTGQFANRELGRKDLSIMLDSMSSQMSNMVNQYLQSCVNHYCTEYGALATTPITSWNIKMQETEAGGGYHIYHYEKGSFSEAGRELVWMIYLNEEFDGGETEFLYQKRRIKPTTGTVVIWPAGFTHTHKGNLVLEGTKYVVTGWYYKQPV